MQVAKWIAMQLVEHVKITCQEEENVVWIQLAIEKENLEGYDSHKKEKGFGEKMN
jgi:predicted RNA-binding protein YlqC (UPF0109 family)